jgi:hypothetical protein
VKRVSLGAFLAAFTLAACGGGGSAPVNSPPAPVATATPATHYRQVATLKISFTPTVKVGTARAKHPQYVSPGSDSLTVTVNTVDGATPPSWVTPNPDTIALSTSDCTADATTGLFTCSVTIPAPPGTVNYTFQAYQTGGASPLLLAENTQDETIPEAQAVSLSTTLRGVVSTVSFGKQILQASTTNPGTSTTVALSFAPLDAAGFQIVNGTDAAPFDSPITLTDGDTSNQTSLRLNGGAAAASVQISNPTDTVGIVYSGEAIEPFDLGASGANLGGAPAITGSDAVSVDLNPLGFSGLTIDGSGDGNLDNGFPTLFFAQASGTEGFGIAELGWTNPPYDQMASTSLDPATCGTGASAVAAVAPELGMPNSFAVTAQNVGICEGFATDGLTAHSIGKSPGVYYISVTAGSIGVSARGRK